jgi:hypothetical protein
VIGHLASQDIRVADMQGAVNAAPTAKEGKRVISALVGAGISGGYLASGRLKDVHWQAQGSPVPAPRAAVAGESVLFVDPAEMPAAGDVARLGQAAGANQRLYELMVNLAAYAGLRWGELIALTTGQISQAERIVTVDGKVVDVRDKLEEADFASLLDLVWTDHHIHVLAAVMSDWRVLGLSSVAEVHERSTSTE